MHNYCIPLIIFRLYSILILEFPLHYMINVNILLISFPDPRVGLGLGLRLELCQVSTCS